MVLHRFRCPAVVSLFYSCNYTHVAKLWNFVWKTLNKTPGWLAAPPQQLDSALLDVSRQYSVQLPAWEPVLTNVPCLYRSPPASPMRRSFKSRISRRGGGAVSVILVDGGYNCRCHIKCPQLVFFPAHTWSPRGATSMVGYCANRVVVLWYCASADFWEGEQLIPPEDPLRKQKVILCLDTNTLVTHFYYQVSRLDLWRKHKPYSCTFITLQQSWLCPLLNFSKALLCLGLMFV